MTVTTLGYTMVICGNTDDPQHRYRGRIEKVKFGVPIQEAFARDIPATLLVLLLKVYKDGPSKKDIWRAPGNQAQVRKLSHIMQHGRLVNIANFSVYTAASVIKKFLSKLPGGIFGLENEKTLFGLFSQADIEKQRQIFCRVVYSLSVPSQHLLVLLFGTFHMISESSDDYGTKMTPDAIGISVAPSLFHTCIHDGQRAKMEDVMRFKIASEVISKIIQSFGFANLFPRECYEFYARITGRTLRVDDTDSRFRFAPPAIFVEASPGHEVLMAGRRSVQLRNDDDDDDDDLEYDCEPGPSSAWPRHTVAYHRLSNSVGEVQMQCDYEAMAQIPLRGARLAESSESTHSLTYLEWVHERQTRRMRTRSEWFLSPSLPPKNGASTKSADLECRPAPFSARRSAYDGDFVNSADDLLAEQATAAGGNPFTPFRQPLRSLRLQQQYQQEQTPSPSSSQKSCRGVVRRRSWRTHYVRPNKTLEDPTDLTASGSTHSTPSHCRHTADVDVPCSRRQSIGNVPLKLTESSSSPAVANILVLQPSAGTATSSHKTASHAKFVHF